MWQNSAATADGMTDYNSGKVASGRHLTVQFAPLTNFYCHLSTSHKQFYINQYKLNFTAALRRKTAVPIRLSETRRKSLSIKLIRAQNRRWHPGETHHQDVTMEARAHSLVQSYSWHSHRLRNFRRGAIGMREGLAVTLQARDSTANESNFKQKKIWGRAVGAKVSSRNVGYATEHVVNNRVLSLKRNDVTTDTC